MMAQRPNPLDLTGVTALPPPNHGRSFSRSKSPTRSPARKAQFAARELDPLLKDLSPDSTLEALQETNAIRGNQAEQTALAQSISDATENERELGIRAAIAAKKLREWTTEVNGWQWPNSKDRAWGAGFISAAAQQVSFGSLTKKQLLQYEERLDEIWDAIETLHITELKDFVFNSHQPSSRSVSGQSTAYNRLRDFTALVTATVIQSLPVLANLHLLLETWSVRLSISKQIPDLLSAMNQVLEGLGAINEIVHDDVKSYKVTKQELETAKAMFGQRVANLGKRVDNMLDLLEGQEDSLPQAWIDSLENIEHKYAAWVIQAERVVLRNELAAKAERPVSAGHPAALSTKPPSSTQDNVPSINEPSFEHTASMKNMTPVKRKPLLEVGSRPDAGHKRGVSEISMAESTLSNYSFENAEIIDAKVTPLLPSPGVSVVDNPLTTPAPSSWMAPKKADMDQRPPVLQRASTASIEPIYKVNVREIMLRRSASHDLLGSRKSSTSTLQPARGQVQLVQSPLGSPEHEIADPVRGPASDHILTPLAVSPSPSLRVDPLSLRGKALIEPVAQRPIVPRRSSKRMSMPILNQYDRPQSPPVQEDLIKEAAIKLPDPVTPPSKIINPETFDDRLKTILASMPAKIHLTTGSDSDSSVTDSLSSSRGSSLTHAMRLSPIKDTKTSEYRQKHPEIRAYHLRSGSSRKAPVKLYIRPVGANGERIMVRVGGGWADLSQYLHEYSLHHGGRDLKNSKLELANYPSSARSSSPALSAKGLQGTGFDFGLNNSPQLPYSAPATTSPWRPPPVPLVPPNMVGQAKTTSLNEESHSNQTPASTRASKRYSTITTSTPTVTTTTSKRYTPLGGAGPVQSNRRVVSSSTANTPTNDAWVEGVVDRARATSGSYARAQTPISTPVTTTNGNTTTVISPVTTITTSMTTSRQRNPGTMSRRLSSWTSGQVQSPAVEDTVRPFINESQQSSQSSGISSLSNDHASKHAKNDKRRSMMGFGDSGGIRRVFLRKKSDK